MQLYDRGTLIDRMISAVRARTSAITYFGPGPFRAFLYAVAGEVQHLYYKLFQVEQRLDVLSASGASLDNWAAARGLTRNGASAASAILTIEAGATITGTGTVSTSGTTVTGASTQFTTQVAVGDSITIDGVSAVVTVVTSNTQLTVGTSFGSLSNKAYTIQKVEVAIPSGLQVTTSAGSQFTTVESVTLKPIYSGALTLRGLARAVSSGTGSAQNVPAFTIRNISNPGIVPLVTATATNEAAAQGGADQESDATFRSRIVSLFSGLNQGTALFYESQVRLINSRVVRIFLARGTQLNEVVVYCATSDGSPLTTQEKQTLVTGLMNVVPVQTIVTINDMTLQPVNVAFTTTLSAGATLRSVANALVETYREFLNWSTWPFGQAVQADDLLRMASATPGIDSLNVSTFTPVSDVPMSPATLPRVGTITITDASTGNVQTVTSVLSLYPRI